MNELSRGKVPTRDEKSTTQTDEIITMDVKILGKDFQVSCPADEQDDLISAASQLDQRMGEIRDTGKVIGLERIAIMAALNFTHEYSQAKDKAEGRETTNLLKKLNRKLDNALQSARQMEI